MWEISNYNQLITFFLSCCMGMLFCLLYDVIRAMRRVCLNSFFAVTVVDLLLWIVYAFATFIFLIATTNGEIRGYVLLGELSGFVLSRFTVSRLFYPILCFVFVKLSMIKHKIQRCLDGLYTKFENTFSKTYRSIFNFLKSVKKLLKKTCKLLYTNKNIADTENTLNETTTKT